MILKHLKDVAQGKAELGETRSSRWPSTRKAHLEKFPTCAVCGGKSNLEVHHMVPFHTDRDKELDPTNLITLCESKKNGLNCHLWFGHLGNFRAYNPEVYTDSIAWNKKFLSRPKNG